MRARAGVKKRMTAKRRGRENVRRLREIEYSILMATSATRYRVERINDLVEIIFERMEASR